MSQWNRSTGPTKVVVEKKKPSWYRGLVALAIITVGSLGAWYFIASSERGAETDDERGTGKKHIKEVAPAPAPKAKEDPVAKPKQYRDMTREEKIQWFHDKYGDNVPENMQAILYFLKNPPKQTFKTKPRYPYLAHRSERRIADMISVKPGTLFIQQPTFDESFDQDFTNALIDKMNYSKDDTDEVRQMKEDVEATKKEIAKICGEEGKTPSQVMNEYAKQMYELGQYQDMLEKEISKAHDNPNLSDEDIKDYISAANVMLKSKGLEEIGMPNLTRRSLHLAHLERQKVRRAERAAQKEREAKEKEKQ